MWLGCLCVCGGGGGGWTHALGLILVKRDRHLLEHGHSKRIFTFPHNK